MSRPGRTEPRRILRRLALWFAVLAVSGYVLGVAGGYFWLRYSRHIEGVGVMDVALLRVGKVRKLQAAQQFAQAGERWKAHDYQEAYVLFISAVRRDPVNTAGRLEAAKFLEAMGATNLRINLLEEGIALQPDNQELNETLFPQLIALGRNRRVLELLHGSHAAALAGPLAPFLQSVELQATLATSGAPAARALLLQHPDLRKFDLAIPVVARVQWDLGEREEAIQLLAAQVAAHPDNPLIYLTLAGCQAEAGHAEDAVRTATLACERFPSEPAPHVLLFELTAPRLRGTPDWWKYVGLYLRRFQGGREAVLRLAELAGRRGWTEVTGALYELGTLRGEDPALLALFQSDALLQSSRIAEARQLLGQLEDQSGERSGIFLRQLRQREITAAAAAGDREGVREYARRLAGLLRGDPDLIEQYRQLYQAAGLKEAVAEFSERKPRATAGPAAAGRD